MYKICVIIKENEAGRAHDMHEGEKKGIWGFWKGKRREKDNFEDLPINGQ